MDSQEVGHLLEECVQAAAAAARQSSQPSEADKLNHRSCRDLLCAELASLLQEAMDMTWPFVPEKWQYKQSVSANDKKNLNDLISEQLPQLLAVLKASIVAHEAGTALAVVFLVDRFLYWTDESSRLLKIAKLLHRRHPDAPVAPQLVIRQARVYLNSGKLQKAEYILSSLINNSGATGCWLYHSESDRALVQAVCVQVRGMILQKLGLWLEAAELIWVSLVGYYSLPQPDKKGIGTSLGLLANILVSMDDDDFHSFRTNPDIELQSLLGNVSHRLLSAAQAAKMAVVSSQYNSLYVLTNVATQGTCLLSYSFSVECPHSQKQSYHQQAREAFAIGLLTKGDGEQVTSKQELHTFLKAAFSLTVTHKWLGTPQEVVALATQACQKALANFYDYCHAHNQDRDILCAEIMHLVTQVKLLLKVEPFINSDTGSFIPDSYRNINDTAVNFTLAGFSKLMQKFKKYHESLCKTSDSHCRGTKDEMDGVKLCITALATTIGTLNTECSTEACNASKGTDKGYEPHLRVSDSYSMHPLQKTELPTTLGSTEDLDSSWQNLSLSSSGSSWPRNIGSTGSSATQAGANACNQTCRTTEVDEEMSDSMPSGGGGTPHSLSQLTLRTISSSLSDSFSSQSSWEKISTDLSSSTNRKPQPSSPTKTGTSLISKSQESDGDFFFLEKPGSVASDSAHDPMYKKHTTGEFGFSSKQQIMERNAVPNADTEIDHATKSAQVNLPQNATTETSTEDSFEMVEDQKVTSTENVNVPTKTNPLCYNCLNHSSGVGVASKKQYLLSQEDYQALLAGVCHECLLKRLHSDDTKFKLKEHRTVHNALHLKFSKAKELWTAKETCVYIGEPMGMQGSQRTALWVQFLHQEERLSSYVGKDYKNPKQIQFHLKDVERQMAAQYYVTEFNKSLYEKDVMAQIFFIPSEALLILNGDEVVGCVTAEPFMLGDFVKLTNNKEKKEMSLQATAYGLAFGHFTYLFSDSQEVVVDLQGWVTANGKGLTYLTDPQIHSTKTPKGPSNFAARGLRYFLEEQHGPECNEICQLLKLPPVVRQTQVPS